jgi:hypothetical protein
MQEQCGHLKQSFMSCTSDSTEIVGRYSEKTSASTTQHITDINTGLNTHYKHTDVRVNTKIIFVDWVNYAGRVNCWTMVQSLWYTA